MTTNSRIILYQTILQIMTKSQTGIPRFDCVSRKRQYYETEFMAQYVRALTSGLCRAQVTGSKPDPTDKFLSVQFTFVLYDFALFSVDSI